MLKFKKIICLILYIPIVTCAGENYVQNNKGDCNGGKYYDLDNRGNTDQSKCEQACDDNKDCVGYSFKPGSCILRKNIHLCKDNEWSKDNGYAYYTKPIKLNLIIPGSTSVRQLPGNLLNKYCLQVPDNAKALNKLETTECSNNPKQLFTLMEDKSQYKIKHVATGLCVDILEHTADNNPTRLLSCDETKARTAGLYFSSANIKKMIEQYNPIKVILTTKFFLATIPAYNYTLLATGDCTKNDITNFNGKTIEECAEQCDLNLECKGFSYNPILKSCILKNIEKCNTREINGSTFYTKKALAVQTKP